MDLPVITNPLKQQLKSRLARRLFASPGAFAAGEFVVVVFLLWLIMAAFQFVLDVEINWESTAMQVGSLAGAMVLIGVFVIQYFYLSRYVRNYKVEVTRQIESSNVLAKFAMDPRIAEEIYDYTPVFLNSLFLGPKPKTSPEWFGLYCENIDWYMKKPVRLFRIHWLLSILPFLPSVLQLVLFSFIDSIGIDFTQGTYIYMAAFLGFFLLMMLISIPSTLEILRLKARLEVVQGMIGDDSQSHCLD